MNGILITIIICIILTTVLFLLCRYIIVYNKLTKKYYFLFNFNYLNYILGYITCFIPFFNMIILYLFFIMLFIVIMENEDCDITVIKFKFK
jgi:hypothetical protein